VRTWWHILAFIAVVVLLGGCSGMIESIIENVTDQGTVTATIDGSAYRDDVAYMEVQQNSVRIYAAKLSGHDPRRILEIVLCRADIPGTVALGATGNTATWQPGAEDAGDEYRTYGGSGTATVTSFDGNRCIGTFSFVARQAGGAEVTVTDGAFNVKKE